MSKRKKIVISAVCICVVAAVAGWGMKIAQVRASIRASELLAEGDAYRELGLWYAAKPAYSDIIQAYPRNGQAVDAKLGLAECLEVTAPEEAIALYEDVAQTCAGTELEGQARLGTARVLKIMDVNEALRRYEEIKTAYPDTEIAQRADLGIVECYEAKGFFREAREKYQEVASRYPDTAVAAEALYKLAVCMYKPGVWKNPPAEQKPILEKLLASEQTPLWVRVEAKWLLALYHLNTGKTEEAKELFRQLVVEFPNGDRGIQELGTLAGLEMANGDMEAGRAVLEEIASECAGTNAGEAASDLLGLFDQPDMWADPTGVPARQLGARASFYWCVNPELAERAFRSIIEQYPDFRHGPIVLFTLGEHFFRQKDYEAAAAEFELMGELYPGSPDTLDGLRGVGLSHGRMENWDGVIAAYNNIIGNYPGSYTAALAQRGIGRIYEVALGDIENAITAYQEVVATYSGTRPARDAEDALSMLDIEAGSN